MASTKFEVSMEIFKFQGEPDVSVTLTGKSPAELNTALKALETIAKTTTTIMIMKTMTTIMKTIITTTIMRMVHIITTAACMILSIS